MLGHRSLTVRLVDFPKRNLTSIIKAVFDIVLSICFRCQLSEHQILNVMAFPDQETKEAFYKKAAGNLSSQIKAMGAKFEFLHGPLSHFGIAGDVTPDQPRSD